MVELCTLYLGVDNPDMCPKQVGAAWYIAAVAWPGCGLTLRPVQLPFIRVAFFLLEMLWPNVRACTPTTLFRTVIEGSETCLY